MIILRRNQIEGKLLCFFHSWTLTVVDAMPQLWPYSPLGMKNLLSQLLWVLLADSPLWEKLCLSRSHPLPGDSLHPVFFEAGSVNRLSFPQLVQLERATPASEPHRAHFVTAEWPYFFLCPVQLASLPPQVMMLQMVPRIHLAHKSISLLPRELALKQKQFFKKRNLLNNSFSEDEDRDHL